MGVEWQEQARSGVGIACSLTHSAAFCGGWFGVETTSGFQGYYCRNGSVSAWSSETARSCDCHQKQTDSSLHHSGRVYINIAKAEGNKCISASYGYLRLYLTIEAWRQCEMV